MEDQVLRASSLSNPLGSVEEMNRIQVHRSPLRKDVSGSRPNGNGRKSQGSPSRGSFLSSALGFIVAGVLTAAGAYASGCHGQQPPGPTTEGPRRSNALPRPPQPITEKSSKPVVVAPTSTASASPVEEPVEEKPYTGPLLGSLALQAPVYATMEFSKARIGYIRLGGKVPVDPKPVKSQSCPKGWYRLLDGGYVCGKYATTDMSNPQIKLGITAPNLEDILPYKYAYNTSHGTPLYRTVPSKEEMARYEPYLESAKKAKAKKDKEEKEKKEKEKSEGEEVASPYDMTDSDKPTTSVSEATAANSAGLDDKSIALSAPAMDVLDPLEPPEEPEKPWWQQTHDKTKPLNVTLADLDKDADGTVAKRMVKGFFVAIDKSFGWNNRLWYKTTSGLVAPSDRMYITKPPSSQGIDFPEGAKQVGFVTAAKASKYKFDEDKKLSVVGSLPRFSAFGLTGETVSHKTVIYRKSTDGWWMRGMDGTFTDPGPQPTDLAPGEKWIDVNLSRKTLVAMEGSKPVYAALVSPGRRSKTKSKDHPTKPGTFRIREKHIAVTMDGDGTVAGDLPYSIEDVPYVAYYDGSYALHGAFWHNNFGREMSHGCVNLSPLDAKKIFFWSDPQLPRGWHAVWSTGQNRGTLVVIHE